MPTWRPSRCSSICEGCCRPAAFVQAGSGCLSESTDSDRSEEHTSELQSPCNLVCRLLLEKKKTLGCDGTRGFAKPATARLARQRLRDAQPRAEFSTGRG